MHPVDQAVEQKLLRLIIMKLGKILLVLIVVLFTLPAIAQTEVTVTDRIVEQGIISRSNKQLLRLLTGKDSTLVGGVVSSTNGNFTLKNIKAGNYLLHVTFCRIRAYLSAFADYREGKSC